jgi:hypothetical protein
MHMRPPTPHTHTEPPQPPPPTPTPPPPHTHTHPQYRALVMASFRLMYPSQAIMGGLGRWLRLVPEPKTARDRATALPARNCRFGRDIGIPVMMIFVSWAHAHWAWA